MKRWWGLFLCLFSVWLQALPLADIPAAAPVVDLAGVIPAEQETVLTEQLQQARTAGLMEASVLTIDSSDGEDLFDYGLAVFRRWGLGNAESNNGLLLIVAVNDRKLRFHTGYGLEGALPDITSKRIIENNITPYFKQGDYAAGIISGMSAVEAVLNGDEVIAENRPSHDQKERTTLENLLVPILMVLAFIGNFLRKFLGSLLTFIILYGSAAAIVILTMGFSFGIIPILVFMFVFFAIFSLPKSTKGSSRSNRNWPSSGGGWSSGGGSSWGGGGSSGGGGAGGSW
ncbi:TPM domain-containing protein [Suttonella sp. R2A3]|uniref:TPM domain-containing protein n=1 Tax=Suttonella sp. R2A3 TaxID=2908648 RepID=UPI001F386F68|nr:TPM domain-containing protein [Suttonella sp. R2A3]UJF23843.1 TPM domain-containing protein [Suttonella sp. R2A3]